MNSHQRHQFLERLGLELWKKLKTKRLCLVGKYFGRKMAADSWTGELDDPGDEELKLQAEVDTL
jgi:hypothetical protein